LKVSVVVRVTAPLVAEMVTGVVADTTLVDAVKAAEVAPAGTVTDAGTVAAVVLELVSVTTKPPAGAAPVSVTVPVDAAPPVSEAGFIETADNAAAAAVGLTVRVVVRETLEFLAVIVTGVADATADVVAVNVPLDDPPGMVIDAGTVAAAVLELVSVTTRPPDGAAPVSVTVPVEVAPPVTELGLTETADSVAPGGGGLTLSVANRSMPPALALTEAN